MLNRLTLLELRDLIVTGQASAYEVVEAHLEQIAKDNPRINAFIEIYVDEARAIAQTSLRGPLAGVPVTVKDSFDIAGRVTACGSVSRINEVAERDSTVVERLRRAGAIVIGKTSAPEFLYYYETDNGIIGRTNHPWDVSKTPGGSSGGEAAAISAFLSAGGVGSDGGGSIRQPAHFCGICGLKPTPGRVPAAGHWPEIAHPTGFMGVAGPMARTARDVRALFDVLAGYEPRDPFSVPFEPISSKGPKPRIWIMRQYGDTPVSRTCEAAVARAAGLLSDLGHTCEELDFDLIDGTHELWRTLFVDLITQSLKPVADGTGGRLSWTTRAMMDFARGPVSVQRLSGALMQRDRLRARLLAAMGERAVILAPGFGTTAFPHGQRNFLIGGSEHDLLDLVKVVSPWNLLGMPSMALPMLTDEDGAPAGVQLIGPPWREELILDLAEQLEEARGGKWQTAAFSRSNTNSTTSTTACG